MSRWIQYGLIFLIVAAMAGLFFLAMPGSADRPGYKSAQVFFDPIEKTPNPFRKQLWLNGKWEFRTALDNLWHTVAVPHVWNSIPGLELYRGKAIYRLEFEFPDDWRDGRTFACFGGLAGFYEIRANGELVANGFSRYTPLEVDITDYVDYEKSGVIEIILDNSVTIPGFEPPQDEKNFGGIYREAYLELRRDIRFRDVRVRTVDIYGATATIRVEAAMDSDTGADTVVFGKIQSADGGHLITFATDISWTEDGSGIIEWEGDVSPVTPWTPDTPKIYVASLVAIQEFGTADGIAAEFGVLDRSIGDGGIRDAGGAPLTLRGATWREQLPGGKGPLIDSGLLADDFDAIRTAGLNSVRFAHPVHSAVLDECDRRGVYAVQEFPLPSYRWMEQGGDYVADVEEQLSRMILRDVNRPSIAAWGLSVAPEDTGDLSFGITARLTELIRSLDPARPVYITSRGAASVAHSAGDFTAVNMFGRDAGAQLEIAAGLDRESAAAAKPALVTAYGAYGIAGFTGAININGSEINQTNTLLATGERLEQGEGAAGWFIDSYADYEGPLVDPAGRRNTVHSGLMTAGREPKMAYEYVAGLTAAPSGWPRSITGFLFPWGPFAAVALALLLSCAVWSGFGVLWPAFAEPDSLDPAAEGANRFMGNILFFGLPMLLAGAAAAAFAFSAAAPHPSVDLAHFPPGILAAVLLWLDSYWMVFAVFFGAQLAWLLVVAAIVSAATGAGPLHVFELLARCAALRPLFLLIPLLPFGAAVIPAGVLAWEIYLQHGILSRRLRVSPARSLLLLVVANLLVIAAAGALFYSLVSGAASFIK